MRTDGSGHGHTIYLPDEEETSARQQLLQKRHRNTDFATAVFATSRDDRPARPGKNYPPAGAPWVQITRIHGRGGCHPQAKPTGFLFFYCNFRQVKTKKENWHAPGNSEGNTETYTKEYFR
jgi:hypothetical protein